jgi:hypothetical protein
MPAQLREDSGLFAPRPGRQSRGSSGPTYTTIIYSQMPPVIYIQVDYRRRHPRPDRYPVLLIADEEPRPSRKSSLIHKDTIPRIDAQNAEISRRVPRPSTAEGGRRVNSKRVRFQLSSEDGPTEGLEQMHAGESCRAFKARCRCCGRILDADVD